MIAKLVLNPRTERAINVSTLQKHFRDELDTGNTRLKAVILSAFYQLVRERDTRGAFRHEGATRLQRPRSKCAVTPWGQCRRRPRYEDYFRDP